MRFSYYQDAREEDGRPPDRWASVRLSRLFEDAFFHGSCAYNVQRLLLILILSYSILPFPGFKLCHPVLQRLTGPASPVQRLL
jgi:hypothetical protein